VSISQQTFPGGAPKPVTSAQVDSSIELTANKDAASGYAGLDANGMLKLSEQAVGVNTQSGTTYTVQDSDRAKIIVFTGGPDTAVTLPQAGASSQFKSGWWAFFLNASSSVGTVTVTPTTSTFNNGLTNLTLVLERSVLVISDGTDYKVFGMLTPIAPADGQVLYFNGADNQWEPTTLSAIGNANAAQIKSIPISASAPADQTVPTVAAFNITSLSITSNVVTFISDNTLAAGDQVWVRSLTVSTFLNNQLLTVLSSGLSGTQFKCNFTHANVGATAQTGLAETIYWKAAVPAAASASVTTGSLAQYSAGAYASANTESGSFTLAKMAKLQKIVADRAARIRLYRTAAARDADLNRGNTTQPSTPQHGVCADFWLDGVIWSLTWYPDPVPTVYNADTPQTTTIYYNITNLSGSTHTVNAVFTYVPEES
jgi:hypothetical protein